MNRNHRVTALLSLALALGAHADGRAQTKLRALLGPTPFECKNQYPCKTTVTVNAGETKPDGTADPSGCTVTWGFNGYVVKWKTRPKLVWELSYTGTDTYKFHPNDGVRLNSGDLNDPSMDLYDQGHDSANGQKFKWRDRNSRKRDKDPSYPKAEEHAIRFDFVVLRDRDGRQCAAGDPVVINMGQ